MKKLYMDKLQLTGQNVGRILNLRNGCLQVVHFLCYGVKLASLKLKTQPKQDIVLPYLYHWPELYIKSEGPQ